MGVNINNSSVFFVTRLDISGNIHLLGTGMAACDFTHLQESQPLLLSRDDFLVRNPLFRESIYIYMEGLILIWGAGKAMRYSLGPQESTKLFGKTSLQCRSTRKKCALTSLMRVCLSGCGIYYIYIYINIRGQNQTYFVGYHLDPMVRRCCSRPLGLGVLTLLSGPCCPKMACEMCRSKIHVNPG